MKRIIKFIKKIFSAKQAESKIVKHETDCLKTKFDSLQFWSPELIGWIGKENDPIKLAVASCLVNVGEWPEWLPGKLIEPRKKQEREKLYYEVEIYRILKLKSETICPNLYGYIWLTDYYKGYNIDKD